MGAGIGEGDKGVTVDLKWALKKKTVLTTTRGQSCLQSPSMAPLGMLLAMVGGLS